MNFVSNCQFFSLEQRNKAIPVSSTGMTPFFFLDPSSQGTGMTGEGVT
ncbi:hypothetical protein [Wolbachia endosymbiont (group A) of Epistrophe grossularia]|nr:hypothetical protein [Wolbachia endosymbiont (group A) of Epistrophe grossularia]